MAKAIRRPEKSQRSACGVSGRSRDQVIQHLRQIERTRDVVEVDDSGKHQGRADHVKRTNLMAAYTRRSCPRCRSGNTWESASLPKRRRRGPDRVRPNTPIIPVSRASRKMKNSFVRLVMLFQETSTDSGVRNPASRIISALGRQLPDGNLTGGKFHPGDHFLKLAGHWCS